MKLSVVSTLYRSEDNLEEYYARLSDALAQTTEDHEIILVDDGSPDDSLAKALELQRLDNRIRVVELSRNFGHHPAIMAGFQHVQGERVFVIDSDLEEDPALLVEFWKEMEADPDKDVVYGYQTKRRGGWFEKISGHVFYFLLNLSTGMKLQPNQVTARLMTKEYVQALLQHRERNLFLAGLCQVAGYNQHGIAVSKQHKGHTSYSLLKKMALCLTAFTSFTGVPLVAMFFVGVVVSMFSFGLSLYFIYMALFESTVIPSWIAIMTSIWFIGGVLMSFIGITGLYIDKIYQEVKARPLFLVKKVHET